MADHKHDAGECDERLFQNPQRRQVKVVGRFVENQEIAAVLQDAREQQTAALAAGQMFHLRINAVVGEQKPFQIGAQRKFAFCRRA